MTTGSARADGIPVFAKLVIGLGDHTINLSLSALALLYIFFLTEYVGLRPGLAAAVPLVGRAVDAFTDPLMGRISDLTTWRAGRRRPYMLIGAIPFGLSFALLWTSPALDSQVQLFFYYAGVYVIYSVASTVLAVPYISLFPEIAIDYQERTSLNAYRAALAVLGTLVAATQMRPLAQSFGAGADGFLRAAMVLGIWLALPWFGVFAVTRERPENRRPSQVGFVAGMKLLARHRAYRQLSALYICARIAVDLVGMMFIFYFQYWLRRPGDFEVSLGIMLLVSVAALPFWLRISRRADKHAIFIAGCVWWMAVQLVLFAIGPEWPRWAIFLIAGLAALGYAVADLMPWSMLGDVVDEDELLSGERREGVYSGFFTFLRKLGGALGVWLAGLLLDLSGFTAGGEQREPALLAIRSVTAFGPFVFLGLAALFARGFPLTRLTHEAIRAELASRAQRQPGQVS